MAIRFYVDADLLGLAKLLVSVRTDVTYPGDPGGVGIDGATRPSCTIAPGTKDPVWIPQVAALGWIVITRDRYHAHRPAELGAVVSAKARHVRLDPSAALNRWGQLEIVVSQWRRIEALEALPGPWVHVVTRTTMRKEL